MRFRGRNQPAFEPMRQQGMTLISFLIVVSLVLAALYVASRLMPVYSSFGQVMGVLREVQGISAIETKEVEFVRAEIARRFATRGLTEINPKDLRIRRTRQGFVVEVRYEKRIPMLSSLGVVAKFDRVIHVPKKPTGQ